ncbi:MAG: methionine--tRNA ligase [Deltaproteobacteria bacterium]|nr:methionine--tRNA ligase [Deltaproteobacteria bacterium]
MAKPFYISTAIPYVNAAPHIGHSLEYIQTDAIARYQRLLGKDVMFMTGTDENSLKNVQAAEKAGKEVGLFVSEHAQNFICFKELLDISYDTFIRTTEERHFKGAQKLWSMCKPEDIYKATYKGLYCVGCEAFYTEDDLVEGKCPEHNSKPEEIEEENYFFKLSNYQQDLIDLINSDKVKITPDFRKAEVLKFLETGLLDFSISRSHQRAHGWGVPVPGDEEQIMYVWFDALSNYITGLDFASNGSDFQKYWVQANDREVLHVLGKGITRFHAIYWLGMLLSAGVPLPSAEFIHGYITVNGQKMSKSLGNVLSPQDVVDKFGCDPVRFYLLGAVSSYHDGDFSEDRFVELYNAHLANGIGNLFSRTVAMLVKYLDGVVPEPTEDIFNLEEFWKKYQNSMEVYDFPEAVKAITELVSTCDSFISTEQPWTKAKAGEPVDGVLYPVLEALRQIAIALLPITPKSAYNLLSQLGQNTDKIGVLAEECTWGKLAAGLKLTKGESLFPRYVAE